MGIRGEPTTPDDPARGQVWTAIVEQIDLPGSQSLFVSVTDSPRENFHRHPWSIGGGGAAELKELLDDAAETTLAEATQAVGPMAMTMLDEVFVAATRLLEEKADLDSAVITGESVRRLDMVLD